MKVLQIVVWGLFLSACCHTPEPVLPVAEEPVKAEAVDIKVPAVSEGGLAAEPGIEAGEGDVVCRKGGDVRIIGIHKLKEGRCVLVYDNRLSGNGTENALPDLAACETQQQRMVDNFLRSGFLCE